MRTLIQKLGFHHSISLTNRWLFAVFGMLLLATIGSAIILEEPLLLAVPLSVLFVVFTLLDTKGTYFLLLASIPISIEYSFPNGLGTDLPAEPITAGFLFIFIFKWAKNRRFLPASVWRNPITILLLVHLFWIFISTLNASYPVVAFKYFLAKIWYIVGYYFLALYFLKEKRDFTRFFHAIFWILALLTVVVVLRHAAFDFSFAKINHVVAPIFRNHVSYASLLVLFLPFLYFIPQVKGFKSPLPFWHLGAIAFFLVAIYLSYTRAAYVAVALMVISYFIIKWRLIRYCTLGAGIIAILAIGQIIDNNKYLDYAPNFERTITHEQFDNLLSATAKGEDISTMERVYRWVAGYHMIQERPVFGFGPGNFYNCYRGYTVTSFQTYVSDNPEKSGIHSYYLMTFVEQGLIGLLIFLGLCILILVKGEQIYHRCTDPDYKKIAMAALLSTIAILAILIINDMVEAIKVGAFFFINMAILVRLDHKEY